MRLREVRYLPMGMQPIYLEPYGLAAHLELSSSEEMRGPEGGRW